MPRPPKFSTGDVVVARHHARYEPGTITAIVRCGSEPLYRIDFKRFELHLSAEEIAHDEGRPGRAS